MSSWYQLISLLPKGLQVLMPIRRFGSLGNVDPSPSDQGELLWADDKEQSIAVVP